MKRLIVNKFVKPCTFLNKDKYYKFKLSPSVALNGVTYLKENKIKANIGSSENV